MAGRNFVLLIDPDDDGDEEETEEESPGGLNDIALSDIE